jgi:Ca-activated chloride channel family protein
MSDITILYPEWLLALLPTAIFIYWLMHRRQSSQLISPHLAKAMGVEKHDASQLLLALALTWALTIVALAGPSFGKQILPTMSSNSARVIVMDMSRSMFATDNKPDRLTQARYKASDLLTHWTEGYTGLVAYAADAYTVSPMTSDTATIATQLPSLSPNIMPYQGADAARGIARAIDLLTNAGFAAGSIVLITDDLDRAEADGIKQQLNGSNWELIILGMGSDAGAPIPLEDGALLQTPSGQTVVAKSNFELMAQLARQVSGTFTPIQLNNSDVTTIVNAEASSLLSISQTEQHKVTERMNHGFWLIPIVLIAALGLFRRGFIFVLLCSCISSFWPTHSAQASPWVNDNQHAKQLYDAEKYAEAATLFRDPEWRAAAQYQAGDYQAAIDSLSSVTTPTLRQQYNLANAYAQHGELEKAKQLYQSVLEQDAAHNDARHNLEQVETALKQQQQQQQQQDKNNQQEKKQDASENSDQQPGSEGQSNDQSQPQNQTSGKNEPQEKSSTSDSSSQPSPSENSSPKEPSSQDQTQSAEQGKPDSDNQEQNQVSSRTEQSEAQAKENGNENPSSANETDNSEAADPELRKLEQVENARDPSRLLRAQLLLQAQRQEPPKDNGKSW